MEEKQNIEEFDDDFLKNILKENHIQVKAPDDFTKKTMDSIMQEWIENPIENTSKRHGYKYWTIIIALICISSIAYIATDIRKLINMSEITWLRTIDKDYLVYIHSLYSYIIESFLKISPIVYIVILALIAIYIADKLINRAQSSFTNFFFI